MKEQQRGHLAVVVLRADMQQCVAIGVDQAVHLHSLLLQDFLHIVQSIVPDLAEEVGDKVFIRWVYSLPFLFLLFHILFVRTGGWPRYAGREISSRMGEGFVRIIEAVVVCSRSDLSAVVGRGRARRDGAAATPTTRGGDGGGGEGAVQAGTRRGGGGGGGRGSRGRGPPAQTTRRGDDLVHLLVDVERGWCLLQVRRDANCGGGRVIVHDGSVRRLRRHDCTRRLKSHVAGVGMHFRVR